MENRIIKSIFETKIHPAILKRARCELGEDEERKTQVIEIIRQWIAQQPHLHQIRIDDYGIIAYARGCKYSLEKMKKKLDLTFTLRTALPEFFCGWNPMNPEIQAALQCGSFLPLKERDYDQNGRKVIIMRPGCYDPYHHKAENIEKANFMVSEIMGRECEQIFITGIVIIVDLEGYTLNHFTQRPLSVTKKHMYYLQNANPISPKSLNFIRTTSTFQTVYNVMLSVLNDKMKQRVKVHGSNFQSLHEEIDKNILPKDYGGNGESLSELTDYWKKRVEENKEFLLESEKNSHVDESRRLGKAKTAQDLFGIEGSFRKLNVD